MQTSSALSGVNDTVTDGVDRLARLGSIGVFVVALIANVSIIIQIPYTLPLLSAALGGADLVSMLVLGVASGLGAGIGAVLAYKVADAVVVRTHAEPDGRVFRWIARNTDTRPQLTSFVIFLVALSPLPDGTIVMPLAMIHYGMRRLAVPLFLGKFVHNVLLAVRVLGVRLVGAGARVGAGDHRAGARGGADLHAGRRLQRREGPGGAARRGAGHPGAGAPPSA